MNELQQTGKCRYLRGKQAHGTFVTEEESLLGLTGATATFWCLRTMGKAGPDEHFVHASLCREGRGCWQSPERE